MGWGYGALGISNMILWIVLVGLVVAAVVCACSEAPVGHASIIWTAISRPRRT